MKILSGKERRYSTIELHKELDFLMVEYVYNLYVNVFAYKQRNNMLPSVFDMYYTDNADI